MEEQHLGVGVGGEGLYHGLGDGEERRHRALTGAVRGIEGAQEQLQRKERS